MSEASKLRLDQLGLSVTEVKNRIDQLQKKSHRGNRPMKFAFCSAFRNAEGHIYRYLRQVDALADALAQRGDKLALVAAYGDSRDDTGDALRNEFIFRGAALTLTYAVNIFEVNHDGPHFGSVVNAQRFRQLATVWNAIWAQIPADADVVIFCESDLIWQTETMLALIDDLEHVPAVAPMVMLQRRGHPADSFYDEWAFRRRGTHFTKHPPYHPDLTPDSDLLEVESAGSCLAIRGDLARQVSWPEEDVVVGLCRQMVERGGSVYVNCGLSVVHP